MAYTKQNWESKTVVTKSGLINMDDQIAKNTTDIEASNNELTQIKTGEQKVGHATNADSATSTEWANVQNKPGAFPPAEHNHDSLYYQKNETYTKNEVDSRISNPNLLDNPYFKINSRGQSSYSGNTYGVDRWWGSNSSTKVDVDSEGITITSIGTSNAYVNQKRLLSDFEIGKTYTLSVLYTDGHIETKSEVYNGINTVLQTAYYNDSRVEINKREDYSKGSVIVLRVNAGKSASFKAIKLEEGALSTIGNDSAPDYHTELIKCMTSTADPTDTYANKIVNFASNPNLLDNPFFTVNQRQGKIALVGVMMYTDADCTVEKYQLGEIRAVTQSGTNYIVAGTSLYVKASDVVDGYIGTNYTADRWFSFFPTSGVVEILTDGVKVANSSTDNGYFQQPIENISALKGKTVTFSAKVGNITGSNAGLWIDLGNQTMAWQILTPNSITKLTVTINDTVTKIVPSIITNSNTTVEIFSMKLEFGAASTLANDVAPNYAEELAKCQRYFRRITLLNGTGYQLVGVGTAMSNVLIHGNLFKFEDMRTVPAVSFSGECFVRCGSTSGQYSVTSITFLRDYFSFDISNTVNLVRNELCSIWLHNGYIDLSADL